MYSQYICNISALYQQLALYLEYIRNVYDMCNVHIRIIFAIYAQYICYIFKIYVFAIHVFTIYLLYIHKQKFAIYLLYIHNIRHIFEIFTINMQYIRNMFVIYLQYCFSPVSY